MKTRCGKVCSRYRTHGCPCGYFGDPRKPCKCSPIQIERYMSRISGPLLDRIDIHLEVPAVSFAELRSTRDGTPSSGMREQVMRARQQQRSRFGPGSTLSNARMSGRQIREFCRLSADAENVLRHALTELGLSARAHDKILRMARTIADLADRDSTTAEDVLEAVHYRRLDRKY